MMLANMRDAHDAAMRSAAAMPSWKPFERMTKQEWREYQESLIKDTDPSFSGSVLCPIAPNWALERKPKDEIRLPCAASPSAHEDATPSAADCDAASDNESEGGGSASGLSGPLSPASSSSFSSPRMPRFSQHSRTQGQANAPLSHLLQMSHAKGSPSAFAEASSKSRCSSPVTPLLNWDGISSPDSSWPNSPVHPLSGHLGSPLNPNAHSRLSSSSASSSFRDSGLREQVLRSTSPESAARAEEGEEEAEGEEESSCLNGVEVEEACRAKEREGVSLEGVTIVPLCTRIGGSGMPQQLLYALHFSDSSTPLLPGDASLRLLFPTHLQQAAQGRASPPSSARLAPFRHDSITKSFAKYSAFEPAAATREPALPPVFAKYNTSSRQHQWSP